MEQVTSNAIVPIEGLKQRLAEAQTIVDLKNVHDELEILRSALKQVKASNDIMNEAAKLKVQCEVRIGIELLDIPSQQGKRTDKTIDATRLQDELVAIGIDRGHAWRWKNMAYYWNHAPEEFEQICIHLCTGARELTSAAILRRANVWLALHQASETVRALDKRWAIGHKEMVDALEGKSETSAFRELWNTGGIQPEGEDTRIELWDLTAKQWEEYLALKADMNTPIPTIPSSYHVVIGKVHEAECYDASFTLYVTEMLPDDVKSELKFQVCCDHDMILDAGHEVIVKGNLSVVWSEETQFVPFLYLYAQSVKPLEKD